MNKWDRLTDLRGEDGKRSTRDIYAYMDTANRVVKAGWGGGWVEEGNGGRMGDTCNRGNNKHF